MALQSHTIYGAPLIKKKRSKDELDVQIVSDADEMSLSQPARALHQPKTRFVPAQEEYNEYGVIKNTSRDSGRASATSAAVGSWYTSLPRRNTDTPTTSQASKITPTTSTTSTNPPTARSSPAPPVSDSAAVPVITSKSSGRVDWFTSTPSRVDPASRAASSSTLADMLRRDPPNVQNPLAPPVYYAIGPANKGYEMLSRHGWEEGQPLGPRAGLGSGKASTRRGVVAKAQVNTGNQPEEKKKEKWMLLDSSMPKLVVRQGEGGPMELVDLTNPAEQEEEEESSEEEDEDGSEMFESDEEENDGESRPDTPSGEPSTSKQSTAILTPIPVALKHDRKGLGASKKKRLVTHSSLALRHHIQQGAWERQHHISETRRVERARLRGEFGRGKRAYARKAKAEQRGRDSLMEYMAS